MDLSDRARCARGLACVLLVIFHAIGNEPTAGMHVARDSGLHLFAHFFTYIRMPLFSFLSGFVYAYRPVTRSRPGQFALSKLRRLLLPMATAATVTLAVEMLRGHPLWQPHYRALAFLAQLPSVYLYPYHHFWFLQALFVVFLLLIVLEALHALATLRRYLWVLAAAVAGFLLVPDRGHFFFSLPQAVYILPFFLLGVGANRYQSFMLSRPARLVSVLLVLCGLTVQGLGMFLDPAHLVYRRAAIALATGMAANLCILAWLPKARLLQSVGHFSFCIYLYHSISLNAARHLLQSVHIGNSWAVLPLLLSAGLGIPMLLHRVAYRHRISRLLVLGDWRSKRREAAADGASTALP
jgi:peptidoglycan/LPS O-acetylase OafA/YrhL